MRSTGNATSRQVSRPGRTILLTGITGFLGARLAARLLAHGYRLVALVRAEGDAEAARRARRAVEPLLPPALRHLPGNPSILLAVPGDLARPRLGIDRAGLAAIRKTRPAVVFHCGGTLTMAEGKAEHCRQINLLGTLRVARLARDVGVRRFHHVSTAYVHGGWPPARGTPADRKRPQNAFREVLPARPRHRNPYERSKWLAERRLAGLRGALRVTVWRPSILVQDPGEAPDPRASGVAWYFRLADAAAAAAKEEPRSRDPIRLPLCPPRPVDLVPASGLVSAMVWLIEHPGREGGILQFTHPAPVLEADILSAMQRRHPDVPFTTADENEIEASPLRSERIFFAGRGPLSAYQQPAPGFDCRRLRAALRGSGLTCPQIDSRWLDAIADQAAGLGPGMIEDWAAGLRSALALGSR